MRRPEKRISPGTVAARLAAVLAFCLVLRGLAELSGGVRALPEGVGAGVLALALPGASLSLPDAGTLALRGTLPGVSAAAPRASDAPPEDTAGGSGLYWSAPASGEEPEDPYAGALPTEDTAAGDTAPAPDTAPADTVSTEPVPETPERDAIGTTILGKGSGYLDAGGGIYVKNKSKYTPDFQKLLETPLKFSAAEGAAVLIIHTHGSEAYNPAGEDIYMASDPSRTEDTRFNVVRVGDELERVLTERGVTVIHDRELYDYPSYNGSYDRSLASIKAHLKENPEIRVVIDLHRDALEGDGKLYKTVADVGDKPCAQVMLICGSDSSGLKHPDWRENLTFALKIQRKMVTDYPTLARPLKLSQYRYNQHATTGSLIAEIGTNGNTLQEALAAVRYFGACLADVLTEK